MSVQEAIRAGELDEALSLAKDAVRSAPTELGPRVLLFQLFAVMGDWDRAGTQLEAAVELDAISIPMARTYGPAMACERLRAAVFAGERSPLVLGEPPEWIGPLLQALAHDARGEHAAAADLRSRIADEVSFGGISFRRYRGNAAFGVAPDKAFFYPEGVEGLFEIYFAPADTFETVNTLGLPLYARTIPDRDRDEWVRIEIESNPLPICTRPQVLRKARRT